MAEIGVNVLVTSSPLSVKYVYKSCLFPYVRSFNVALHISGYKKDVISCPEKALLHVIASRCYHLYCHAYLEDQKKLVNKFCTLFCYMKRLSFFLSSSSSSFFLQEMGSSSDVTDSSSNEAGHVIATTIRGRNGLPKQVRVILL